MAVPPHGHGQPSSLHYFNNSIPPPSIPYSWQTTSFTPTQSKHPIPELGRNLRKCAWKQVVKDWEHPDPSRSLFVAMKDWDSTFFKSRAEEVKFGQRQLIAVEFINVCISFYQMSKSVILSLLTSFILGTIITEIVFFKITLKPIWALWLFWKLFVPDSKKMENASFAAKGLIDQYSPFSLSIMLIISNLFSLYIKLFD